MERPAGTESKETLDSKVPDKKVLILACGALAKEILYVIDRNRLTHVELKCLPASLHSVPEKIPGAVKDAIQRHRNSYERILIGYGDCGTGGLLDKVLQEEGIERIEGAHCYAFYSGLNDFKDMEEEEIGSFYLTDFLARQFDAMVVKPLGLDRYPELRDTYFGNYTRVVYLAQSKDRNLEIKAEEAAKRLNLPLTTKYVGYGDLEHFVNAA